MVLWFVCYFWCAYATSLDVPQVVPLAQRSGFSSRDVEEAAKAEAAAKAKADAKAAGGDPTSPANLATSAATSAVTSAATSAATAVLAKPKKFRRKRKPDPEVPLRG